MKRYILLALSILALCLNSCGKKENNQPKREIGKYIYRDDNYVYHINSKCIRLIFGNDENGHEIYGKHPIDTTEFIIEDKQYFRVCANCCDDSGYEHLLKLSDCNRKRF